MITLVEYLEVASTERLSWQYSFCRGFFEIISEIVMAGINELRRVLCMETYEEK